MIRFFISSTFRDMFGERNLLHKEILPQLREYARFQGEYVDICDLRWGMNPENDAQYSQIAAIMDICLSEIDACNHCFIAFLGDAYGTVADQSADMKTLLKQYGCELEDYDISLTQMELEYAVFHQKNRKAQIKPICMLRDLGDGARRMFREMEGEFNFNRQRQLKKRLQNLAETREAVCIPYQASWNEHESRAENLQEMKEQLLGEAKKAIQKSVEKAKAANWVEREFLDAEAFRMQYTAHFGGRRQELERALSAVRRDTTNTVCIFGASGCGKSTLMAKISQEANERTCLIACGHGIRSRSYLDILKQLSYFVEKQTDQKCEIKTSSSEEKLEEQLKRAIVNYEQKGKEKLVLLVDALDKVNAYGKVRIPELLTGTKVKKVTIIFSQIQECPANEENIEKIRMTDLTKEDIQSIISESVTGKGDHFQGIAEEIYKKKDFFSPLYVTLALNILQIKTMDYRDGDPVGYCRQLVAQMGDMDELVWENLQAAGACMGYRLYESLAGFLAAAQEGLRESDLEALLYEQGWKAVDFILFRQFLSKFFRCQSNGCWTFGHDLIKAAVQKRLEHRMEHNWEKIRDHMRAQEANDEIRIAEGLWAEYRLQEFELTKTILEEGASSLEEKIHMLIMTTLYAIARKEEGREWFLSLCRKYPAAVERMLNQGLMHRGFEAYERRYPAKNLADIYLENQSCEDLQKSLEERQGLENKMQFSSFCAEYVGIYEDISRHWDVFLYEVPVYEFTRGQDFASLPDAWKEQVYRQASAVFFANNRILNDIRNKREYADPSCRELAETISQGFIAWMGENILEKDCRFPGREITEGKFVNNIAQYYSSHADYQKAYGYRKKALLLKTGHLLDTIAPEEKQLLLAKLESLMEERRLVEEHEAYWEDAEKFLHRYMQSVKKEEENGPGLIRAVSDKWVRVAVSYQTIGSDCYHLYFQKKEEGSLWEAGKNMMLSLKLLQASELERQEKERVKVKILMAGIAGAFFAEGLVRNQKKEKRRLFLNYLRATTDDAILYLSLDKYQLDKLYKNIAAYQEASAAEAEGRDVLEECLARLSRSME